MFRHHEAAGWLRLGLVLAGLAACLVGIAAGGWLVALVLVPLAAVFTATAAMRGHEGSHRSFSASPARNQLLFHLTFPLLSGMGALYWRDKHDVQHHGHPNVRGSDPDIDLWPMVTSREDHERSSPRRRRWQRRWQGLTFWPLTTLMPVVMRVPSITYLGRHARRHGVDRAWLIDAGCLAAHYTAWLLVPSLIWGPLVAFALYASLWGLVGLLLAMVFAPAHLGLPLVRDQHNDWRHQLETTRNLRVPRIAAWLFVGLDHQIEHHLFPRIAHQELPRAAPIVAAWCRRVGAPYRRIGYGAALRDVTRFMGQAWNQPTIDRVELRRATE